MASQTEQLEAINRLTAQQVGILKTIQGVIGQINATVKNFKGGSGGSDGEKKPKLAETASVFDRIKGTIGSIGKGIGIAGAVVGAVVAALSAVPLAVLGVVRASESFVRALNPSAVEQYEKAQNDLRATVGSGLQPVIAYATKSLKEWAGILLPSIQKLQPVIDRISAAVSGAATGVARALAATLERVAVRLEMVLPDIESLINSFGALIEVVNAVADFMDAAFGQDAFGGTREILRVVADKFKALVSATTVLTARLLKLAGSNESLQKFRDSLQKAIDAREAPKSGLTAAPTGATTGSFEDLLRRLQERAFVSTLGTETKKSDTDYLKELVGLVDDIQKDDRDWRTVISDAIRDAFNDNALKDSIRDAISDLTTGSDPLSWVGLRDASSGGDGRSGLGTVTEILTAGSIPFPRKR